MSTLRLDAVSRWYGNVVAVNDVTMDIGPGITGLLGPNGAGKSTVLSMMAGLLAPSAGEVTLDGRSLRSDVTAYRTVGLVPVQDALYDFLTARQFVRVNADLHGLPRAGGATSAALALVGLSDAADRRISTFSKGMRQRVKMAAALVHDPPVLLLDEPFNGMDPVQRQTLTALLAEYARQGRTIVFSSHILEEVESLATQIQVIVSGRHAASGAASTIRQLMTDRPNRFRIRSSDNRQLAAALMEGEAVSGVRMHGEHILDVEATDLGGFAHLIPRVARDRGIRLFEVTATDESLEQIFSYLVGR